MRAVVLVLLAVCPVASAADKIDPTVAAAWGWTAPKAAPVVAPADPYGFANYRDFYDQVKISWRGILVVGIADPWVGTYMVHCRVPSGFEGLADGEYDYWMQGTQMVRSLRKAVKPVSVAPKAPGGILPTPAPVAGVGSTPSLAPAQFPAPTGTNAPWIILGGGTEGGCANGSCGIPARPRGLFRK